MGTSPLICSASVSTCGQKSVFTFDKTLNSFFLGNILAWTILTCVVSFVYHCSKFSKLIQPTKHELLTEHSIISDYLRYKPIFNNVLSIEHFESFPKVMKVFRCNCWDVAVRESKVSRKWSPGCPIASGNLTMNELK